MSVEEAYFLYDRDRQHAPPFLKYIVPNHFLEAWRDSFPPFFPPLFPIFPYEFIGSVIFRRSIRRSSKSPKGRETLGHGITSTSGKGRKRAETGRPNGDGRGRERRVAQEGRPVVLVCPDRRGVDATALRGGSYGGSGRTFRGHRDDNI